MHDLNEGWQHAMLRGNFAEAWRLTDRLEFPRRAVQVFPGFEPEPSHLRWNGEWFDGKDVIIRCLHGLGDTLQFLRFIPALKRIARSVTLLAQPHLVPFLELFDNLGTVRNGWTNEHFPHDVEIEIMELAYAFRITAETLGAHWLAPPVERIRAQAGTLIPHTSDQLRVGLVWQSGAWDPQRSIPASELALLSRLKRVTFFSLQQDAHETPRIPLIPLFQKTRTITAAAAAMLELDLLITVDSMPAHLAGLLGRPVWLLLKHDADWRWGLRDHTPWYPRLRIFQQDAQGSWNNVMEEIAACLSRVHTGTFTCRND